MAIPVFCSFKAQNMGLSLLFGSSSNQQTRSCAPDSAKTVGVINQPENTLFLFGIGISFFTCVAAPELPLYNHKSILINLFGIYILYLRFQKCPAISHPEIRLLLIFNHISNGLVFSRCSVNTKSPFLCLWTESSQELLVMVFIMLLVNRSVRKYGYNESNFVENCPFYRSTRSNSEYRFYFPNSGNMYKQCGFRKGQMSSEEGLLSFRTGFVNSAQNTSRMLGSPFDRQ